MFPAVWPKELPHGQPAAGQSPQCELYHRLPGPRRRFCAGPGQEPLVVCCLLLRVSSVENGDGGRWQAQIVFIPQKSIIQHAFPLRLGAELSLRCVTPKRSLVQPEDLTSCRCTRTPFCALAFGRRVNPSEPSLGEPSAGRRRAVGEPAPSGQAAHHAAMLVISDALMSVQSDACLKLELLF